MAKRGKKRNLSLEDQNLWQIVSKTVTPLSPPHRQPVTPPKPASILDAPSPYWGGPPKPSGRKFISRSNPLADPRAPYPFVNNNVGIRADKPTRRGKIKIDRKIDLHDLTQDQAFMRLENCIKTASLRGQRNLLVVTGKGGVALDGVLRANLPVWLSHARIRPLIANYSPSHARHGGAGAFYVFLKCKS